MTGYESKRAAAQAKVEGPIHVVCQCDKCKVQPAQEPVTWAGVDFDINTTPPQRPWVGLTEEEVDQFHNWKDCTWSTNELVRYVEAKLKEKNT